jgi:hypothetical protein
MLIRRINARRSDSIRGRPPRVPDFQRQYLRKPARCQRTTVSGTMLELLGFVLVAGCPFRISYPDVLVMQEIRLWAGKSGDAAFYLPRDEIGSSCTIVALQCDPV